LKDDNAYLQVDLIADLITLTAPEPKQEFSDEEVEEIMDMHEPGKQITVREIREMIQENPLLVTGLVFAFGLLVGVSLSGRRTR
jgi:hypothetical protein